MKTTIKIGDKVSAYWNLHKKVYSVGYYTTGKLITHVRKIALRDAKLVVQPAGNQRVRNTKNKNVHAFIKGTVSRFELLEGERREVYYNPYKHNSFVYRDNEEPVKTLDYIELTIREGDRTSLHTYENI